MKSVFATMVFIHVIEECQYFLLSPNHHVLSSPFFSFRRAQLCSQHYNTTRHAAIAGMNLLSNFCIAVSATQKLNCVAVGVIRVAVFFLVCFGEKIMLNSVTLSQLNQSRELNILKKKR